MVFQADPPLKHTFEFFFSCVEFVFVGISLGWSEPGKYPHELLEVYCFFLAVKKFVTIDFPFK